MSGGYPSVDLSKLKTYHVDTSPNSAHSCSTYGEVFVEVATNVNYTRLSIEMKRKNRDFIPHPLKRLQVLATIF